LLGQPVTPRTATTSARVISAGRIHFDCVAAMIPLTIVFLVLISLSFLLFVELSIRTTQAEALRRA
jgi:hypothetical protein